jgi:hypothetical protein
VLGLWGFYLSDWALLAALPYARKSFGPAQPPTLALALLRLPPALLPLPLAGLTQLIGTGLVIYGFWIEPHTVTVTHQTLQSAKLKPAPPLRVLHLGDLHIERLTGREHGMLAQIKSLQPDLILFTGDFLNLSNLRDPVAWEDCRAVLRALSAPLGVFTVTGSPAVDLDDIVPALLAEMPHIRWLKDEAVTVAHQGQAIEVIGLSCTHRPFADAPKLQSLLPAPPPLPRLTILLYHSPDLAPEAAELGIDVQLSGHTHGGQVRVPGYGALYAGSLYGKRFETGRYTLSGLTLYVTRGIGMEGKGAPRVRFLCPPEMILWELSG